MKLLRYELAGHPTLGALKEDRIVSLEPLGYATMPDLIKSGPKGLARAKDLIFAASPQLRRKPSNNCSLPLLT